MGEDAEKKMTELTKVAVAKLKDHQVVVKHDEMKEKTGGKAKRAKLAASQGSGAVRAEVMKFF